MTPAAKCRRLATMLRTKAELEHDPEVRAEWKVIARGYLILANLTLKWANGGIVFFFAVTIAIWFAAVWFVLVRPPARLFAF
jgi:hypothetical protein